MGWFGAESTGNGMHCVISCDSGDGGEMTRVWNETVEGWKHCMTAYHVQHEIYSELLRCRCAPPGPGG
ncbi:hypothetical protein FIBSPDRAFT_855316 [Athelia psychrophila]|uniref:Uncharacterized protein n=1 Tax=Athelia psychrophila TaxID=1759441 RepID=A0A166PF63_9AGAM|nr:hypothetical protein FIBSPDRAFT_855316 [Fibularhizoctonia sp. CBS 109695]